jgi:hypothetical protein
MNSHLNIEIKNHKDSKRIKCIEFQDDLIELIKKKI